MHKARNILFLTEIFEKKKKNVWRKSFIFVTV